MENISSFFKIIITISIMWSIGEYLLTDKQIKKYTSFAYGLVVISIFISLFANTEYEPPYDSNDKSYATYDDTYIKQIYEINLEKILSDKFNDSKIDVTLTDDYKIKDIKCKNKSTYDEIMRYLYE